MIDPPRASTTPVAPNRLLLLAGVLLLSLSAGLAASFVASQLRPVFYDGRLLRQVTGLPVLGTVSLLPNAARMQLEKRWAKRFFAGLLGLIGVFASGIFALALLSGRLA